ncbi:MAG TPA: hypothetical protein PK402_10740 [Tepidisphaeraceae bacterium]|nr:hypothetical protein [Tepidisphaeraceae bacterium]
MNLRRSIRLALSGFLFLTLGQLTHARSELPKEVTDLFAKLDAAAQKPFASELKYFSTVEQHGKKTTLNFFQSTCLFISPNRYQYDHKREMLGGKTTIHANNEQVFVISESSDSVTHDASPTLDKPNFEMLRSCDPNLAIAITGSTASVLLDDGRKFVELTDDSIDGKAVIRFQSTDERQRHDYYIDPQHHRILLVSDSSINFPPPKQPPKHLQYTLLREPTEEERNFEYSQADFERDVKEAEARRGKKDSSADDGKSTSDDNPPSDSKDNTTDSEPESSPNKKDDPGTRR